MTRDELEDALILTGAQCKSKADLKLTVDAMVAAYNRALEDAVNSLDSDMCFAEESSHCTQNEIAEGILKLRL